MKGRRVICHHVGLPWNALGHVTAAVFALVLSGEDTLLGGCAVSSNSLLEHMGLSRGVIHEGGCGDAAHQMARDKGADLGKHAGVLKVTVCDGACGVVSQHELVLDLRRKCHLPHAGVSFRVAVDSPHPSPGSVSGPKAARVLRNNFSQVRGATPHISS